MKLIFKLVKEITIILGIYFLGLWISDLIKPLILIPGNIIGMGLLFLLLNFNIVKTDHIEKTSSFLLRHMGFFFIPLCVSLYVLFDSIRGILIQIMIILVVSNIFVMAVTGKTVQKSIEMEEGRKS
ncbi:holin-like protein [Dethiosulfatibacter aminovorans DSM 17477]|uniref:Holin-like protein n=1 Tax=Dethiosulfatibacter aminovorans DSM 17477 TaxID=1121476 RepID=A0A1M6GLS6_9FIRM|nr:CidA/LrgA family protein [Dethiosulfatibacter aminovorans]SHJ10826.1 holin-like protein [Dethiosulfatibacter aminovorans DSM 17477]